MKRVSPIDVLEAAYRVELPDGAWIRSVLDAMAPLLPPCVGLGGYLVGPDLACTSYTTSTGAPFGGEDIAATMMPSDVLAELFFDVGGVAAILSESVGRMDVTPSSRRALSDYYQVLGPPRFPVPIRDFLGVLAFDAERQGAVLCAAYDRMLRLDRAVHRRLFLLGMHIAAAARLRRRIRGQADGPFAVLNPDGSVAHAEKEAQPAEARASLRAYAVTMDRARGALRTSDPDGALGVWKALLDGRWSLVDRFESDGRRYVVAHRNEPAPARRLALTRRERQVVEHRLLGHSAKLTSYALGIKAPAVSIAMKAALDKLGLANVAALVEAFGGLPETARGARPARGAPGSPPPEAAASKRKG